SPGALTKETSLESAISASWPAPGRGCGGRPASSPFGGAAEAVVDRLAEAVRRDRHHRDGRGGPVEGAERGEEIGGGLGQVARGAEVADRGGAVGAGRRDGAEGEERLAGGDVDGIEADPRGRGVVLGEHAGRGRRA